MSALTALVPAAARQHLVALRALLVFTVLLGLIYPLALTVVGQLAFHHQANGSLVSYDGRTAGSTLLGQQFSDTKGKPLPQWFQPRPSVSNYDPLATGASNLGPTNPELVKLIAQRRAQIAAFNRVPPNAVPPDALTASGSGLDPDISPAYAYLQVDRVARARGLALATVRTLVRDHIQGRSLGFLGEPRVDVLALNLALARLDARP